MISHIEILSHKLIASDRKSNSIHRCLCMHVRGKRPIQSVSVSDNVLNIARQITECQLFIMASRIDTSFTVSQMCHIHIIYDESRSKNTPYDEVKSKWICLVHQKKRNMLSSPLNNYHVHLKYQFSVRLHLLSICAMLINVDSLHICIHIYFSD